MEEDNTFASVVDNDGIIRRLPPAEKLDAETRAAASEDVQRIRDEHEALKQQPAVARRPRPGDGQQETAQ